MPSFTTTIEDNSPIIVYSAGQWRAGTSKDDSSADQYSQSSFTVTQQDGATMSFTFNGTGVQIFGAKRANHGPYRVELDGNPYYVGAGTPSGGDIFQTALFSTSSPLQNGEHTVKVINQGTTYLDIDFISWQWGIGRDDETLLVDTFQDTDPSFLYLPASSWSTNPDDVGWFMGGTGHATNTSNGYAEYTFERTALGDAMSLYGPVGPKGGPYSVQLDGGTPKNFISIQQFYRPQMMLYHTSNLGPGNHTAKIQSQSSNSSNQVLAIDFAAVYTAGSFDGRPGVSETAKMSVGTIAGITVAAATSCFIIFLLIFFLFRGGCRGRKWYSLKRTQTRGGFEFHSGLVEPFDYNPVMTSEPASLGSRNREYLQAHSYSSFLASSESQNLEHDRGQPMALTNPSGLSGSELHTPVTKDRSTQYHHIQGHHHTPSISTPFSPPGTSRTSPRADETEVQVLQASTGGERHPTQNYIISLPLGSIIESVPSAPPEYTQEPALHPLR